MSADNKNWDTSLLAGSVKRNIVNPDITEERAKCNFDQKEIASFVIGDQTLSEMKLIREATKDDPAFHDDLHYYELSREEQMSIWWRRVKAAYENPALKHYFTENHTNTNLGFQWSYMFTGTSVLHLHQSMFTKSINFLASEEQRARWIPLANNLHMLGCYAQTELGHGSNVQGLETRAVFDKATDEFVFHTPSIRATKWWPGGLGLFATHAVVMAKLILDGNAYGVQAFLVPIRDRATHKPFPGIEVGDLGPKLGYSAVDNGWLSFKEYRVPRSALLSRFVSVSREGEFELLGDPRLIYQIMSITRMNIIYGSAWCLLRANTIATRFAVCRRQFAIARGKKQERKIIDYQTHMQILGPNLANSYVLFRAARYVDPLLKMSIKESSEKGNFKMLDICHHFTAGFKAFFSDMNYRGCDELRSSCGGAGIAKASGIVSAWEEYATFPTFEGVNVLLYQQASRKILKIMKKVKSGKKAKLNFEYINHIKQLLSAKSQAKTTADVFDLNYLETALKVRAAYHLETVDNLLSESKASKSEKFNELFATDVQHLSKAHISYIVYQMAKDGYDKKTWKDAGAQKIFHLCLVIYALNQIQQDNEALFETGFFGQGSSRLINEAMKEALVQLRPQMIPLVEILPDDCFQLSGIGNYHGDIYESMYDFARSSALNNKGLPPFYEPYMKPLILGNGDNGKFKL